MPEKLYTVEEASKIIGCSYRNAHHHCVAGHLRHSRLPAINGRLGHIRIRLHDIERFQREFSGFRKQRNQH